MFLILIVKFFLEIAAVGLSTMTGQRGHFSQDFSIDVVRVYGMMGYEHYN